MPRPAEAHGIPLPQTFVPQGALCYAAVPSRLTTILGSCVSVCLWDRDSRSGGMNHFVLPSGPPDSVSLRYGDVAMDRLVARMLRGGATLKALEAKIFGGAAVLVPCRPESDIGQMNVLVAEAGLRRHGIRVTARRTGGQHGVLIHFFTETARVLVRPVSKDGPGGA